MYSLYNNGISNYKVYAKAAKPVYNQSKKEDKPAYTSSKETKPYKKGIEMFI